MAFPPFVTGHPKVKGKTKGNAKKSPGAILLRSGLLSTGKVRVHDGFLGKLSLRADLL